jgi:nucleoside-diphosphate-sugar epimerase
VSRCGEVRSAVAMLIAAGAGPNARTEGRNPGDTAALGGKQRRRRSAHRRRCRHRGTRRVDRHPAGQRRRDGYRASKIRAERVIQGWSERDGVRVPVIGPAWMWGPGDAAPTASVRLFLAVARGELRAVPRVGS